MKYPKIFALILLVLSMTACKEEAPFISGKVTYEEALALESIQFTYEDSVYESTDLGDDWGIFFCHDWPGECGLGKSVFYKSFGTMIPRDDNRQIWLRFTPGIVVGEGLVEMPNTMYYDSRLTFKDKENLKDKYLAEGSWLTNDRKVKVKFTVGNRSDEFYFNDLLSDSDHFEVLEIKQIKDRDHSFLVSGSFNAIIPDGRTWLPANEQMEPQVISDGKFQVIIEPLEKK